MSKPIKIYSGAIEGKALDQFYSAIKMDFAVKGALMPDAHAGYALPIGAVVATEGVIVPAWIGYDIGCGVFAGCIDAPKELIEANKLAIFHQIYRDVPTGFDHNKTMTDYSYTGAVSAFVEKELIAKGAPEHQCGTLGGGNHFIEIGYDEKDRVWIVIHSGSRNVGHKIATHYMKLASGDGKAREGHYGLDVNSHEGGNYIADLAFGLDFALANRAKIFLRTKQAVQHALKQSVHVNPSEFINRNHNHAELKDGLWIHRKGATHADEGMMGVIPGNMRDGSFIVRGKGNPDSLCSSSHGAGRVMGRAEAKRQLNMDDFIATMQERGIQARVEDATLDEAPSAYKNIFEVMANQTDLVEVIHHIKPLINIKG